MAAKTDGEKLITAVDRLRDCRREKNLLLGILTRGPWRARAHIAPAAHPRQNEMWNWVVCVHYRDDAMAWRISDLELVELFAHLPRRACEQGEIPRHDKMEQLEQLNAPSKRKRPKLSATST